MQQKGLFTKYKIKYVIIQRKRGKTKKLNHLQGHITGESNGSANHGMQALNRILNALLIKMEAV